MRGSEGCPGGQVGWRGRGWSRVSVGTGRECAVVAVRWDRSGTARQLWVFVGAVGSVRVVAGRWAAGGRGRSRLSVGTVGSVRVVAVRWAAGGRGRSRLSVGTVGSVRVAAVRWAAGGRGWSRLSV